MKRTDGFDARRLRPKRQRSWGSRLAAALGLVLIVSGVLFSVVGVASLFDGLEAFASLRLDRQAAMTLLILGMVLMLVGTLIRRSVHRRLREPSGLSMSPRLKKKR
ncbi:hypothetical protein [Stutzerimonas zhaodongensis]|uniref:hypothetical protein n=1 Tax=Stutzerimonas TaxID=2901164 RepID=UPI00388D6E89